MSGTQVRERLRDPAYFALHLKAAAAIRDVDQLNWYDSHFLRRFEVARRYLARVNPETLAGFLAGFDALKPRDGFRELRVDDAFVPARWAAQFGIPELGPLCDLFSDPRDDGLA